MRFKQAAILVALDARGDMTALELWELLRLWMPPYGILARMERKGFVSRYRVDSDPTRQGRPSYRYKALVRPELMRALSPSRLTAESHEDD